MADRSELSERARTVNRRLGRLYKGSATDLCALEHKNAFELLIATILSAQCTDERVNMVVPAVFARYPEPEDLREADPAELENLIHSIGFFRAKARNLIGMARVIVDEFDCIVPNSMDDLVKLPGVGRKTANVILSVAYGHPGLPVDTHVLRLTRLLGLVTSSDAVKVESELCDLLPKKDWGAFSLRVILHGRAVCIARRPQCGKCVLSDICPSSQAMGTAANKKLAKVPLKNMPVKKVTVQAVPVKKALAKKVPAKMRAVNAVR